jgi:hypothetical protein
VSGSILENLLNKKNDFSLKKELGCFIADIEKVEIIKSRKSCRKNAVINVAVVSFCKLLKPETKTI